MATLVDTDILVPITFHEIGENWEHTELENGHIRDFFVISMNS